MSEEQWPIAALLLAKCRQDRRGWRGYGDRQIFISVLWIMKTGAPGGTYPLSSKCGGRSISGFGSGPILGYGTLKGNSSQYAFHRQIGRVKK